MVMITSCPRPLKECNDVAVPSGNKDLARQGSPYPH
jgi:hypothetical protein